MPTLATPFAQLDLIRQPEMANEPLQAFDAADEYLLAHLHEQGLGPDSRVLLLNDGFGALACSLAAHCRVTSSGDSHLGHLALQKNLARNGLAADRVTFVPASATAEGPFDWVLVRVPKTLALLEEQLIRLHGQLVPGARVIAGAMIKHLPRAAGDLLEQYIGPVQASLAVKKARLLTATPEARPAPVSPYPTRYQLDKPAIELLNHANVFCREGLDIGTRAFLPHLPKSLVPQRVADLGCGNGVLAIAFGFWLWFGFGFTGGWLHVKTMLVTFLIVYHALTFIGSHRHEFRITSTTIFRPSFHTIRKVGNPLLSDDAFQLLFEWRTFLPSYGNLCLNLIA